jgi:heme exporter protein A
MPLSIISLLEVNNLACVRNARVLFSSLSFVLMPGEILQIIGNNGSGKTSLLKLVSSLLPVEHGTIACHTENLLYVGHKLGIKLGLTVKENLQEVAVLYDVFNPLALTQALERFELLPLVDLLCAHLSAGQRQRVALARLLLLKRKLWILDEPYAHLDQNSCETVTQCMDQHCAAGGGVILTTHKELDFDSKQTLFLS